MTATLRLIRRPMGVEVRRDPYQVVIDGNLVGSIDLHDTAEFSISPGTHTLQIRSGRNSSGTETFDVADDRVVTFRCSGKRFLPLFLLSFAVPRLALVLRRE
jgi:hypothetical protein